MSPFSTFEKRPGTILHQFLYGSLGLLLACLCVSAYVLCATSLRKERERIAISDAQLVTFLDIQYRSIVEETWTKNYEAIDLRVSGIAQQLGNASYEVILTTTDGKCIHESSTRSSDCQVPARIREKVSFKDRASGRSILQFDPTTNRYIYSIPLSLGEIPEGFLIVALSDPYQFYRGGSVHMLFSMFGLPILAVVLIWLAWLLIARNFILRPYLSTLVRMEKVQALGSLAAQVAHDIRSPLVALKSALGNLGPLPASERRLITAAASRIENIANDLITQFSGESPDSTNRYCFVASVIDSIVAEKRAILNDSSKIDIYCQIAEATKRAGIPLSAVEFSRVLSNLLNNAIEGFPSGRSGSITIQAVSVPDRIFVLVSDTGMGIVPETLHKLRTVGGSYGKAGGAGMGLTHAKTTLASIRGSMTIESTVDQGTVVTLEIPLAALPSWFCNNLDFSGSKQIVVLDDDLSVHYLWKQKLDENRTLYLEDPEQFDVTRFPVHETTYILDHEICGSPVTGLDLIQTFGLGSSATLVTSHFNDVKLQRAVEAAGAKILPKFMISSVPIIRAPRDSGPVSGQAPGLVLMLESEDHHSAGVNQKDSS